MAKSKWEKRVNRFDTWYDRRRAQMQADIGGIPLQEMLPKYERITRSGCIARAYTSHQWVTTGKHVPFNHYMGKSDVELEKLNQQLPYPIPYSHSIIDSVMQCVHDNADFLSFVMGHREDINEVIRPEEKQKLYLLDVVDAATCSLHMMLLASDETELMVMEADLAEKAMRSKNSLITAEDLEYVPFNQTFLEFHRPVTVVDLGDGNAVKAVGVAFYKNVANGCYSVIWYREQQKIPGVEEKVDSMMSATFCPVANLHRVIFDGASRESLGLEPEDSKTNISGFFMGDEERLEVFNRQFNEAREQLLVKTRNIWDFITSRNIDYDVVQRSKRDHAKVRRYKHLQGKMLMGPRVFKMLKINKTIKRPEFSPPDAATGLGYRELIPGAFHKWVYCRACGRVHRHDLIGQPCRNCKKVVGPTANIEIKKWWHEEYWRGEGEVKSIVREMRD